MKKLILGVFAFWSAIAMAQPKLSPEANVATPAEAAAIKAAAANVTLDLPAHIVFVGDSLTAFFSDLNYVAIVRTSLHEKFGDRVVVTNAGVRGDTITRVLARLEKDVLTLKPTPTHVFIFLGHNDSKVSSASGYTKSDVAPEDYESQYRQAIQLVENRTHARVTVISSASSVFEITKATADKSAKSGKAHNLFGDPVWLERFNGIARKVAAETGADYLDIYGPMKALEHKADLFAGDGVHINQHGNRFVAVQILNFLANPNALAYRP